MYCGIELLDWEALAVVRVTSTPPTRWALVYYGADWARMTEGGVGTAGSTGSAGVGGWSVEVLRRVVTLQGLRDVCPSDACTTSSAGSGACVPCVCPG